MNSESSDTPGDRFEFSYQLPEKLPPGAVPLTLEEAEQQLLATVEKEAQAGNPIEAVWNLANFYKATHQVEKAGRSVRDLLSKVPDVENKAYLVMSLGQLAEQSNQYDLAMRFYMEGVSMEPCSGFTWYFLHNNLGYSLNQLGRFAEGEVYCRRAIAISSVPQNAHKNLGLSLQGQGKYAEAAHAFVAATQANASDARSTAHLEQLLEMHPELQFEFGAVLESCKQAVAIARQKIQESRNSPPATT